MENFINHSTFVAKKAKSMLKYGSMDINEVKNAVYGTNKNLFECYFDELVLCNKKFNLTSILSKNEVFIKHFIDSAVGADNFKQNANVLEVGSGAGFPSLPLKIVRSDLQFTLVESTGKKCGFLTEIVDKLNLNGVKVVNARAEELAMDALYRERYDAVCARAVARLNVLCEYCLPFVKVGGTFIAYKGDCDEEIKEAENAIKILGAKIKKVERYALPDGLGDRALVIIEKIKPTPEKYPRGNGKERKQPIL